MDVPRSMVHQLHAQAAAKRDQPALWTQVDGTWLPTTWREYARKVRHCAQGLIAHGFKSGDTLVVMGFSREEWVVADVAAMAAGGVPVGIYTTSSPEQVAYIAGHCEAKIALVENEAYLERLLSVRAQLPKLGIIVVMEAKGKLPAGVLSWAELLEQGKGGDQAEYHRRVDQLQPSALATLIYTSGTTGHPKGVMLSHRNLTWTTRMLSGCAHMRPDEVLLSYLPLSHIAEQISSIHAPILIGMQVYFARSFETVPAHLKEVRPTVFFGVPRVWEKFKAKAESGMEQAPAGKKRLLSWARGVASRWHALHLSGRGTGPALDAQLLLARRLVFEKLKARIGFERTRIFATSAAPISRDVLDFFASIDIVLREVYGQSEVTGPTTVNTETATRLGSLGRPMTGVEVRIADDGEILVRGENVCLGYYKEPAATAELIQNGWLHSGDVGELDAEGYLRVTGRKKEIIVTSGGKKTPPATLEGLLKEVAPLGNAMVVGDNRNYLTALLALDPEKVPAFAQSRGFPAALDALAKDARFLSYLHAEIEAKVNARVARFEHIRKFAVLPHDFTIEGGELTSTLKVRRKVVAQKYSALIDALYSGGSSEAA
jgi:long-chain acyl-CoA synthetase